ncbi:hypothetical protein PV08_09889 [Exophiala spinifera]|uniref:Zn(2)-C6 fungal-type domain-containing protein n=1 Tax=Exophiala spinifera TaxID=91928 RepID=A0A0D1YCG6_9EURO|nr:uncharacterized protein PV08_09889 [Exophiala spinifera]KIW12611.1 hypothetical protein PV08_09889 [Exophiala spinifera]
MTSPRVHETLYPGTSSPLAKWWDESPGATIRSLSFDLPQLLSEMEEYDLDNVNLIGADPLWDSSVFSTAVLDTPRPDCQLEHHQAASPVAPVLRQLNPERVHQRRDQQGIPGDDITNSGSKRSYSSQMADLFRITSPPGMDSSQTSREAPTPRVAKQALRRQNRSCDQCRSAKRACDLSNDSSIPSQKPSRACSLCTIRGVECTATWLANKQSSLRGKKRPRLTAPIFAEEESSDLGLNAMEEHRVDMDVSPAAPEANLAKLTIAEEACSQHFNLYVDVFDIPISHCLFLDSMPPGYSLGVAALSPIKDSSSLSGYLSKADAWIKSCWNLNFNAFGSTVPAPHIFHTVSVLDAVFQRTGAQPYRSSMTSRDVAITETYKWAAIALAARFAPAKSGEKKPLNPESGKYLEYRHDVALAAWEKAKEKVFGNIAATTSFRVALSLLLFGLVPVPGSTNQGQELDEDAEYAFCEGVRRLHTLCAKARQRILVYSQANGSNSVTDSRGSPNGSHDLPHLSPEDSKYILELLGAVEWLINIINAVAIGVSRGKTQAFPSQMSTPLTIHRPHDNGDTSSRPGEDRLWLFRRHDLSNLSLMQTESKSEAFTTIWCKGAHDDVLLQTLRRLSYVVVVIWKSLADLTMAIESAHRNNVGYEENVFQHYETTISLLQRWRSAFGILDSGMRECFDKASDEIWRTVAFTSNDCDLAILLFCDLVQRFEIRLAQQPFTPETERLRGALRLTSDFRKTQRLISAEQVSLVASTCRQTSRPGFEGSSGLKSHIQDIAAHPNPSLMVHLHTLAGNALRGEVHSSISQLEGKRVSELTRSFDICRETVQGLKETLVTFPDIASSDDLEAL